MSNLIEAIGTLLYGDQKRHYKQRQWKKFKMKTAYICTGFLFGTVFGILLGTWL